jgi:acyl carrier protein
MVANQRTIASLLATGMRHEGTIRQCFRKDGIFHDGWQYGMVSADYFQQQATPASPSAKHSIDEVVEMVASVLTDEAIAPESTSGNTPSWDSLNHMAIMEMVSQRTGLELSPSQIMRANSVRTLWAIINQVA